MAKVRDVVSNLVQMLEAEQEEAADLVDTMDQLQSYLDGESKNIIEGSLDRLMSRINADAAEITRGTVVVLVSPQARVTVKMTRTDKEIDPYLRRLKSQHFQVLTLSELSHFIQSAKTQVAEGNLIPVIRFLMANRRPGPTRLYSPAPTLKADSPLEPSSLPIVKESPTREISSPRWNLSDFLPAPFPRPPLPRGLSKNQSTQS